MNTRKRRLILNATLMFFVLFMACLAYVRLNLEIQKIQDERDKEKQLASLPKPYYLHAVLRPDSNGRWSIQNDVDHAPHGVHPEPAIQLVQSKDFLRIYFDRRYKKAGVIQVTTDDNFAGSVQAHSNLGRENATIYLRAHPNIRSTDRVINPENIWRYVPKSGGGGESLGQHYDDRLIQDLLEPFSTSQICGV